MKLKFYVLTSEGKFETLDRHNDKEFSGLPISDTVVVINSLDPIYIQQTEDYCKEKGLEYYVTESNGTPAKGKNSVLDLFLESENDYCVLIDGDDFLTEHGVWMYRHLAALKTPPDAVCLVKQASFQEIDEELYILTPFTVEYAELIAGNYYETFKDFHGLSHEKSTYYASLHKKYYTEQQKYSEGAEAHCRVTWFSKKAAKIKFNEEITIGEDTLQMLSLKHEALENRLTFYSTDERPATYIYDQRTVGTVMNESEFGTNYDWMDDYLQALSKMKFEGQLHENKLLPELKIDYPKNYEYSELDFKTTYTHSLPEGKINFPKNATFKSINNAYKFLTGATVDKAA
jgi:hypothetical protein|tara:strand:+ start:20 stop:1054 length:1035 start_codon:yes stop_codon:yes gene_type:complete